MPPFLLAELGRPPPSSSVEGLAAANFPGGGGNRHKWAGRNISFRHSNISSPTLHNGGIPFGGGGGNLHAPKVHKSSPFTSPCAKIRNCCSPSLVVSARPLCARRVGPPPSSTQTLPLPRHDLARRPQICGMGHFTHIRGWCTGPSGPGWKEPFRCILVLFGKRRLIRKKSINILCPFGE